MIEGGPHQPENLEGFLDVDKENIEQQLEKASEILLKISESNNFSTFSHFGKLVELVNESGGDPTNSRILLEKWDYSPLDFIQTEKCGNCVDFAVLGQKMLLDAGIPTSIIGKYPDPKEFSETQIDFMGYRHTSLLYANKSKDLELFMFEPGWKFPKPIAVTPGIISGNQDWQFETVRIDNNELVQKTYNMNKKKYGERIFSIHPLGVDFCRQLTKRLIRIPRKLEAVNELKDGVPTYFIRFDPHKQILTTNLSGIEGEFLPDQLSTDQTELLETSFEQQGLVEYLSNIINFYKSLPNDFWIKD